MGIILLLAGILKPVAIQAKRRVLEIVSTNNLRQLHSALTLYRIDHDGEGVWGSAESMGLPPVETIEEAFPIYYSLRPPLAPHPLEPEIGQLYWTQWMWSEQDQQSPSWAEYASEAEGHSVIFIDPFVTPPEISPSQGSQNQILLSIHEGGQIVKTRSPGDWRERQFWHNLKRNP